MAAWDPLKVLVLIRIQARLLDMNSKFSSHNFFLQLNGVINTANRLQTAMYVAQVRKADSSYFQPDMVDLSGRVSLLQDMIENYFSKPEPSEAKSEV